MHSGDILRQGQYHAKESEVRRIQRVSGNKELRKKGIGCAQSQDREAQKKSRFSIDELEKALNDSMN